MKFLTGLFRLSRVPYLAAGEAAAFWVIQFSGKAPNREMRGFAGREKQPQSGAFGTAKQQPAS